MESAVRELLAGKKMLLVGGNKGQSFRKDDLLSGLQLASVEWPDMDWDTNENKLTPYVDRADVVLYLIRFSRHSYGRALTRAKGQGKLVARITRGLGYRRIVADLYDQWVRPTGSANKSGALS
jgi:hypothetical protein